LMQRSSTDGMGLSGSSSNSFLSGRSAASLVTRATAVLATIFILLSLVIGIVTSRDKMHSGSIVDKFEVTKPADKNIQKKEEPVKPAKPSVPRPE
ncbi:MAG: preprotein translocase subunit SecG, partial [Pseudomonadota bacterium]